METKINIKNVKKWGIISVIMLFSASLYSQMAVVDASSNTIQAKTQAQMIKQVGEALKQTEKLSNMVQTAQKNLEFLEKINTEVKNINKIKEIAISQKNLINEAFDLKKQYGNTKFLEVKLASEKGTNMLLEGTRNNLQELSRILSQGTYNMNDAERLREIRYQQEDMAKKYMQLQQLKSMLKQYEFAIQVYDMKLKK